MPPATPPASNPATPAKSNGTAPTQTEAFLFFYIIKHMKAKPDVDWDAVAADAGFKNGEVAKVRFGQVKRKLGVEGGIPKIAKPRPAPSAKTKPPVRRSKAAGPTGVTKKTASKAGGRTTSVAPSDLLLAAKSKNNLGQGDDDEGEGPLSFKLEPFDPIEHNRESGYGMGMSTAFEALGQQGYEDEEDSVLGYGVDHRVKYERDY